MARTVRRHYGTEAARALKWNSFGPAAYHSDPPKILFSRHPHCYVSAKKEELP